MIEYKCLICGKAFKSKVGLGTHIAQYERVPMEKYYLRFFPEDCKCPFCGEPKKWKGQDFNKTCCKPECIRRQSEETNLKKYGNPCSLHGKDAEKKTKAKMLEKYGSENWTATETFKQKAAMTKKEKYGNPTFNNPKKFKQTCLEKYGVEAPMQNSSILEKSKNTCMSKYGGWFVQTEQIRAYRFQNFKHDGLIFNSSDEIRFYDFCKKNNLTLQVHNISPIKYIDDYGKEHLYYPDFKLKDRLIEVKGDLFFNENGVLTNPYTDDPELLNIYKCKGDCIEKNNVLILKSSQIRDELVLKDILIKEKLL